MLLQTLNDLGLRVNTDKSHLHPSQTIGHIGYGVTSTSPSWWPIISVVPRRIQTLHHDVRRVLYKGRCTCERFGACYWPVRICGVRCIACTKRCAVLTLKAIDVMFVTEVLGQVFVVKVRKRWNGILYKNVGGLLDVLPTHCLKFSGSRSIIGLVAGGE